VKDGLGPEAVLRYFQLLAEAISLDEIGQTVDDALVAELDSLSEQVRGLLTRTG
jgi:hypothetical protein